MRRWADLHTEATGKILSSLPGIEPRSLRRPAHSQTLYWLSHPASRKVGCELNLWKPLVYNTRLQHGISMKRERDTNQDSIPRYYACNSVCSHRTTAIHFRDSLHALKSYDMGPTALIPLRMKACCGLLSPLQIRPRPGLNPRTLDPMATTLTITPPRTTTLKLQWNVCCNLLFPTFNSSRHLEL
jgi:hypothetical protein